MIIPKGLPIKLWVNGQLTFNQTVVANVKSTIFNQKFQKSDNIELQLIDSPIIDFYVVVVDVISGEEVKEIHFDKQSLNESLSLFTCSFNFSDLDEGVYKLNIYSKQALIEGAVVGLLGRISGTIDNTELFTITASVTGLLGTVAGTGTVSGLPYSVWVDFTLAISGTNWRVTFDNNNGASRAFNFTVGSGTTIHRSLVYFDGTMKVTIEKLNNGGLAEDAGNIVVKVNGVTYDSTTFIVNDDVSYTEFDLTGLSNADEVNVELNEG